MAAQPALVTGTDASLGPLAKTGGVRRTTTSLPPVPERVSLAELELSDAPRPARPRSSAGAMHRLHRLLARNPAWNAAARIIESRPLLRKPFTWAERKVKAELFGCRMCGQCALPTTAYACPQTCPKQERNGPCGGVYPNGACEVY